ncbi:amino acid permease [candidate division WWE3 bacterium]|nr:amino acid permease [candidate division WWE3 bacterium]
MPRIFWLAIAMHVGTTIGAGIFAIPYVTAQSGYPIGLLWLLITTILVTFTNIAYASIIAADFKKPQQLAGYAAHYISPKFKSITGIFILVGYWGSLLAYIIGMGKFLSILVGDPTTSVLFSLLSIIFVVVTLTINLKLLATTESLLTGAMLIVILVLICIGFPYMRYSNLSLPEVIPSRITLIAPYGVMLNALMGYSVIPEMGRMLKSAKMNVRSFYLAVIIGSIIPAIVYLLFQLMVTGVSGPSTSEEAIAGLLIYLPSWVVYGGAIFGALAIITSFLTIAYATKDTFLYDFNISPTASILATVVPPAIFFLAGVHSFVRVLEFGGTWSGTYVVIIIWLMHFMILRRHDSKSIVKRH